MTYAAQELVIRDAATADTVATWDGPVARRLDPGPATSRRESPGSFEIFLEHNGRQGEVYAIADTYTGSLSGVALWFPFTPMIPPPADYGSRLKEAAGSSVEHSLRHHGYYCQAEIHRPDDGPPLWTMWRPPMP